ncbi:MAG: DUF2169 domain-containing protein [Myxococcales bacterium]|nr:DUF2169 domain-containing protein [Myxococcales bacterium]
MQQVSARDPEGDGFLLAVIARRTYDVAATGACLPSREQTPLSTALLTGPADPNLLLADLDVLPTKPRTDLIVHGHVFGDGEARTRLCEIRVGGHSRQLLAIGRRRCALGPSGRISISAPKPFDRIPLGFDQAYGGRDRVAEARHGNPLEALAPFLPSPQMARNQSPYLYPRNPCGRGYLIEASAAGVDALELPSLEDPYDLLTPERLVVGDVDRWVAMPIPRAAGWVHWGWFPRALFGGLRQEFAASAEAIPEVAAGHVPTELLTGAPRARLAAAPRFACGAALDLQLPHLAGNEAIAITHVLPARGTFRARLPGPPRRLAVDGRDGRLLKTKPILQTVIVEPEAARLITIWRGAARARRPYFAEELAMMPLCVEW